ncbi:hypothetical protein C8Q75DRAFT_728953 [Abortiporus biennis]|nr:hypothetical protein C8Q75DRAFT_728953 [Abortiporus biennis]
MKPSIYVAFLISVIVGLTAVAAPTASTQPVEGGSSDLVVLYRIFQLFNCFSYSKDDSTMKARSTITGWTSARKYLSMEGVAMRTVQVPSKKGHATMVLPDLIYL